MKRVQKHSLHLEAATQTFTEDAAMDTNVSDELQTSNSPAHFDTHTAQISLTGELSGVWGHDADGQLECVCTERVDRSCEPARSAEPESEFGCEQKPLSFFPSDPAKPDASTGLFEALAAFAGRKGKVSYCRRPIEEMTPRCWHERSERRKDIEHPEGCGHVVEMTDPELARKLGWVLKNRARGLSALKLAILREWRGRALVYKDIYGYDRSRPHASAAIAEALRKEGIRGGVALLMVGLTELAITQGKNGFSLSAPQVHSLWGLSKSQWWAARSQLEALGAIETVNTKKQPTRPQEDEHAETFDTEKTKTAPVQNDTNCYVPGPWLLARLDSILGLFCRTVTKVQAKAKAIAHEVLMQMRRARARANNTYHRDRNRKRAGLAPRTWQSDAGAEIVAHAVKMSDQAHDQAHELAAAQRMADTINDGRLVPQAEVKRAPVLSETEQVQAEESAAEALEAELRGERCPPNMPSGLRTALEISIDRYPSIQSTAPEPQTTTKALPSAALQLRAPRPKDLSQTATALLPAQKRILPNDNQNIPTRPEENPRPRRQALDVGGAGTTSKQLESPDMGSSAASGPIFSKGTDSPQAVARTPHQDASPKIASDRRVNRPESGPGTPPEGSGGRQASSGAGNEKKRSGSSVLAGLQDLAFVASGGVRLLESLVAFTS